jgi:hypothetical protein
LPLVEIQSVSKEVAIGNLELYPTKLNDMSPIGWSFQLEEDNSALNTEMTDKIPQGQETLG